MVIPVWALSLPLPAVLLIAVCAYMLVLGVALWGRHCFKVECGPDCCRCCGGGGSVSVCEYCYVCAETLNCSVPSLRSCLDNNCPSTACHEPSWCPQCSAPSWPCGHVDLTCTCQRPQCDMINCCCLEIRFRCLQALSRESLWPYQRSYHRPWNQHRPGLQAPQNQHRPDAQPPSNQDRSNVQVHQNQHRSGLQAPENNTWSTGFSSETSTSTEASISTST